jgi:glycerol kinase
LDAYFSATKLAWMLDNLPSARARAEAGELAFGTVDTFLTWRLSKGKAHVTDPSNASRTMLFDIGRMEWSDELLELFKIPRSVLPEVVDSSGAAAETTLFGDSVPIAGIAGDQQAATFGQACFKPGMAKNTYGTGCFLLMNQGGERQAVQPGLLGTVGWRTSSTTYAVEGSVFIAGAVVQWLRDELRFISSAAETQALAESVPDCAGAMLVPAFVGLGAPHWDSYARGTLVGLTRGVGKAHIVRAALESIAFQTRDVIEEMQKGGGPKIHELRVDGGASSNDFLMQFQADILGIPVLRPKVTETTALGAAYLAGLGVGFWKGQDEIASQWQVERRFEPQMSLNERDSRYSEWLRAVERAKSWALE